MISFEVIIRGIIVIAISYLLGSLNFGIIITKAVSKQDIRKMGSGNAGSTNVLRSVGVWPAIFTFLLDFAKAAAAVLLSFWIFSNVSSATPQSLYEYQTYGRYLAGLFVVIGHMYPLYFNFKGGKGVVTTLATILLIEWRIGLILLGIFLIIVLISRYVALGSMVSAACYGFITLIIKYYDFINKTQSGDYLISERFVLISALCAFLIGYLVIFKHYENIYRLAHHTEKKLSFKHKDEEVVEKLDDEE